MATDVETRLLLSRQVKMEPKTEEIDNSIKLAELPNLVQCGTIEDLLHDIAPQQPPPGPSQCWEVAWNQVLEALDAKSLPHVQSCGSEGNEGFHSSQKDLKEEDASEEYVSESSLSLSLENMWMLQFQLGDDIESCLESFEQAAKAHRWPKEEWVAHLKPHLSPKAFLACCNVAGDYSVVKTSILRHHGITPEIQWRCFRQYRYHKSREGPREAYRKLRALAWRWLKDLTKEQVLEQLVLEQFLAILPQDMQSWVRRCGPKTCARAVDLAEGFQLGKKPSVSFKDVSVKFSDAEWTLLSEKQRTLYQDTMLEIFQNVSSLGLPREKHEFIAQVKKGGELDFQDDAKRGCLLESELKGNSLLPVSKEYCMETKSISKKVKKPAEKTQEHSGQVQSFGNEPSSPETQPVSQSPTKVPSVKTQPTKRQTSSPKGRKHQKKEQQPPTPEEPASKRKQSPSSLPKEEPHNQELSDDAISTHKQEPEDTAISTPKPRKRKKGTPPQSEPPKKKKQAVPIGKHFKMKKKSNTQEEPHELQEGLPVPEKTSPHKKSQRQQEAQQAPSPDENAKPRKVTTSGVTWHPPFSATVASDLTCLECGRSFKQRADLRHHQYVHTREKPYACTMCSKCFRHPSHLHIHQRTHSGERPYKCPECGKTFSQSCNLRTHRQIHTGKKPFQCSVCSKCFYHRSNLTIHKRVHTGERPYSCSVCPKSFSDRSTLVQHERTHTGERPYACLVCKQRFSQMSHLTKHSRVHSDARSQPKMEPTGVLAPSPPKNCMSQPNGKDGSFKKTEAKQGQNTLTSISKMLVSSSSKDRLPQNKDAT